MIEKENVSIQMALTVRIACSGIWAGSLMIMGPMHEEMSFKIDMLRGQDRESRSSQEEREIQKIEESPRPLRMVEDLKSWYVRRGID